MDPAVPRDHLKACLLLVLGEETVHGYDLHALLAPFGLATVDRGFLYRTLRLMEADGLVTSVWDPSPAGPARRVYQVTEAGQAWTKVASASLREADHVMAGWLRRYRQLLRGGGPQALPGVPAAS